MENKIIEKLFNGNECNLVKKYYGYTYDPLVKGYNKVNWLNIPIWVNDDIYYYFNNKEVDEYDLIKVNCYLFCYNKQLEYLKDKIKFCILITKDNYN